MSRAALRAWSAVHTWTGLLSTAVLLLLCVTGLPLIFHDEIDRALGHAAPLAGPPSASDAPGLLPLDAILARARAARPGEVALFMAFDPASPLTTVTTGPAPDAPEAAMTLLLFDRVTGLPAGAADEGGVMHVLLRLHTDLFAGLPGALFLGAMGLVFLMALVSGVVLYAPFMRRLPFGALRLQRPRVRWLDWHNLLGIAAAAWLLVVGLTGVVHTLAQPIFARWRATAVADMTSSYAGRPPLPPARYGSLDRAMAAARAARPGADPQFVAFPGGGFSSGHHYAVFLQGSTPLTRKLLTPALVDAETGRLTDIRPMPWYVHALQLSQPLHFGDYGGLPLKLIWAALDLFAIAVLWSGLKLWLQRRRAARRYAATPAVPVPA